MIRIHFTRCEWGPSIDGEDLIELQAGTSADGQPLFEKDKLAGGMCYPERVFIYGRDGGNNFVSREHLYEICREHLGMKFPLRAQFTGVDVRRATWSDGNIDSHQALRGRNQGILHWKELLDLCAASENPDFRDIEKVAGGTYMVCYEP